MMLKNIRKIYEAYSVHGGCGIDANTNKKKTDKEYGIYVRFECFKPIYNMFSRGAFFAI